MAVIVEVVEPETLVSSTPGNSFVVDVVHDVETPPTDTVNVVEVVEVVSGTTVLNAVVSDVQPTTPYEGQVWIKVI